MRRIITVVILCLALAGGQAAFAHEPEGKRPDRKEWFKQLRCYKHDFLTKELSLTKEQQEKFFPLYDEMENQIHKAQHEAMMMEHNINKSTTSVSDLEYEKATEAMVEVKSKEASIEGQYLPKFREVLSAKQLFKLKQAERKFTQELMKQHNRMREKQPRR